MGKPNLNTHSSSLIQPTAEPMGGFSQGVHATGENQWGVLFSQVFLETHHYQSSKVSKFPKKITTSTFLDQELSGTEFLF